MHRLEHRRKRSDGHGYTSDIISQKGILGDGLNFITKPFDRISLHNKIQEVLGEEQQPCQ